MPVFWAITRIFMAFLRLRKPARVPTCTHYSKVFSSNSSNLMSHKSLFINVVSRFQRTQTIDQFLIFSAVSWKVQNFLNNLAVWWRGRWLQPLREASKGQRSRWISISIQQCGALTMVGDALKTENMGILPWWWWWGEGGVLMSYRHSHLDVLKHNFYRRRFIDNSQFWQSSVCIIWIHSQIYLGQLGKR